MIDGFDPHRDGSDPADAGSGPAPDPVPQAGEVTTVAALRVILVEDDSGDAFLVRELLDLAHIVVAHRPGIAMIFALDPQARGERTSRRGKRLDRSRRR